ncbi:DNA polymerase III subunit gamma/tau [Hutsoniella sourekii]|uniref:DNA polymerase III subunit gamma/tau n=1 Tax=Hutsoniella sourekii TaxID=87650 RepID=UPI000487979D|nr:DNA polymerase III subunit gamma/tau [Hutsoniella sourekii]
MSYQALYRVWRPQSFDELVGQPVISETLKNAVRSGRFGHAYLFTGPRGTGKTSAAKILAKAINCPNQTDGNPCNQCDICQGITEGQISDVVEIDAASNNGVEEIRELRDNVRYAASVCEYKVYIIDEVHMLTTGAFNALLKTLEEPPAQVVFILATTEPHKIPATIISRTQRFDFQRIQLSDLMLRMEEILQDRKVDYEKEALSIIGRAANGGMRDSLSLLDQALAFRDDFVSIDSALEVSGSLNQLDFITYLKAVYQGESEEALQVLHDQFAQGKQASRFVDELTLFVRDLLLTNFTQSNYSLLSEAELEPLADLPVDFYYRMIDGLDQTADKMHFTTQPDLYLEVMTIQIAQGHDQVMAQGATQDDQSVDSQMILSLKDQMNRLEEQLAQLHSQVQGQAKQIDQMQVNQESSGAPETSSEPAPEEPVRTPRPRPNNQANYQVELEWIYYVLNQATHQDIQKLKSSWESIVEDLPAKDRAKFAGSQPLAAGPEVALVSFESKSYCGLVQHDQELLTKLDQITQDKLGQTLIYVFVFYHDWPQIRQNYTILRKQNSNQPIQLPNMAEKLASYQESLQSSRNEQSEPVEVANDELAMPHNQESSQTQAVTVNSQEEESEDPSANLPDSIAKMVEAFGEENVNIYYDR